MKKIYRPQALALLSLLVLEACASAKIYQNEDGSMNAVYSADSKEDALSMTYKGAKKFCSKEHKQLVVGAHTAKYEGAMDEKANSAVKSASRVASILGATTAGAVGYSATSDNKYAGVMKFHCK